MTDRIKKLDCEVPSHWVNPDVASGVEDVKHPLIHQVVADRLARGVKLYYCLAHESAWATHRGQAVLL